MHAWLCENPIGVEALQWKELPTPVPKAGEVVIAIKAASLNFPDLLTVQNKYQFKPPLPFVPGSEYAGVVEAVGEGVKHLKVGDAVAAIGSSGGFATHACVAAAGVMPLPPGFAFDDAAAFVMTYGTTHHALVDRAQLKAGETLLVLGAAGGVGSAAIQIGKVLGARVIAAASSDEKCAFCTSIGADSGLASGTSIGYMTTRLVPDSAASLSAVAVISSSTRSDEMGIRIDRYSTSTAGPIADCGASTVSVSGSPWVRR